MRQHVIRSQDFTLEDLAQIFRRADKFRHMMDEPDGRRRLRKRLRGRIVNVAFYEPSTRTLSSFVNGAQHLGAQVFHTADAGATSSAVKGETFAHTVRMFAGYRPDVLVVRHKEEGRLAEGARILRRIGSRTHLINAGDGPGQHPTQALLDVYTLQRELGRVDGIKIMMGGDLKHGRTVRSLAYLLTRYRDVVITFAAPEDLQIGADILAHLDEHGVKYQLLGAEFRDALAAQHAVYWTRLQLERVVHEDVAEQKRLRDALAHLQREQFCIGERDLHLMRIDAVLMHPLPINDAVREIALEVENDERCAIFRQAENGMYVRMALLDILVNG